MSDDTATGGLPGETYPTERWRGVTAVAFAAGGAGIVTRQPALMLVAVVAVAFAAHARAGTAPAVDVSVERELATAGPRPGEEVEVRLWIRNDGDVLLPDVRLVDGVPEGLSVPDGDAARHGTALRPDASEGFVYTVEAHRGVHEFDPVTVAVRDAGGSEERQVEVAADGDGTLTCIPPLGDPAALPLRRQTMDATGEVLTREGGSGLSFHSVREYRRGDPFNRIDWNRTARTGELSTVEFQREQAAAAVVAIDARDIAYSGPEPDAESALERSVSAAGAAVAGLLDGGNRVGLAVLSPVSGWVAPGAGETHRARLREALATDPGLSPVPPEADFYAYTAMLELRRRLPAGSQVILFSPLPDDYSVRIVRRLDAYGHRVTVVAPDPTTDGTAGRRIAGVQHQLRIGRLRKAGVRVVDWGDEPFPSAVERSRRRWSA